MFSVTRATALVLGIMVAALSACDDKIELDTFNGLLFFTAERLRPDLRPLSGTQASTVFDTYSDGHAYSCNGGVCSRVGPENTEPISPLYFSNVNGAYPARPRGSLRSATGARARKPDSARVRSGAAGRRACAQPEEHLERAARRCRSPARGHGGTDGTNGAGNLGLGRGPSHCCTRQGPPVPEPPAAPGIRWRSWVHRERPLRDDVKP